MNIRIATDETLKVRQAAQFLGAFTLLDDAFAMTEESAAYLVQRLNDAHPHRSLGHELQELGRAFLDPDSELDFTEPIDSVLMDLVVQSSVNTCSSADDLELVIFGEGNSIRGQFRKKFASIGDKLRKVFSAIKNLAPSQDGQRFKDAGSKALKDTYPDETTRETAAGLASVAAVSIHTGLREVNANDVLVFGSDDENPELAPTPAAA